MPPADVNAQHYKIVTIPIEYPFTFPLGFLGRFMPEGHKMNHSVFIGRVSADRFLLDLFQHVGHFYGGYGSLDSFVTRLGTSSFDGLLYGVGREDTEAHRDR